MEVNDTEVAKFGQSQFSQIIIIFSVQYPISAEEMNRAASYTGATHDPFEKIDVISISKVDYWVDQLNEDGFDADKVAEIFFATKKESEISSTLSKITSLQDNIEKILRAKVTANYMTFIKARDTIKQTGLEMSELRALVDKTSELIQDVRSNRLGASKSMRKNSMMAVVNTLANAPKMEAFIDAARQRANSSSSDGSYSDIDSMGDTSSESDEEGASPKPAKRPISVKGHGHGHRQHNNDDEDLLGQYGSSADPYAVPDWLSRAPDELSRLIIERSYSAAVKLVVRIREYSTGWAATFARDRETYKEARGRGETEDLLSLHGLSKEERKAAVNKQNTVVKVAESIELKQQHLARTLMASMVELPHSPIWGMDEQRKRLRMMITLGHHSLAAEAFSKSRMNIIQVVLRDVEASGDPKVYITDICKGFYNSMLDVTMSFLQLFSKHAHIPSIMSILIIWAHHQTSALVEALMQQVRLAAKEYSALAIIHLKPKITTGMYSKSKSSAVPPVASPTISGDGQRHQLIPSSPMTPDDDDYPRYNEDLLPLEYPTDYLLEEDLRSFVGPLKFTRDCINIALQQASDMNATGMQGFAELSWLMLPQLKKLVNGCAEDLIKETLTQVRLDTWLGMKPRVIKIFPPSTLVHPQAAGTGRSSYVGRGSLSVVDPHAGITVRLGASFDWLTVCLTHFIDDVWCLLRIQNTKSGMRGAENRIGKDGHDSSDNEDAGRNRGGENGDDVCESSEDAEDSDDEEIDERTGKRRYKRPSFRRVNLCEIEPIAVTSILRVILHYVLELERVDIAAEQYAKHSTSKQVLLNTCVTLREITIPSVMAFISDVMFNLRMVSVLGNLDNDAFGQAPGAILQEISSKLVTIEAAFKTAAPATNA